MDSHEEYLELCAASTAGELSGEEQKKLAAHLAVCASCRRAKREYEIAVQTGVPALADELGRPPETADPSWSVDKAEAAFFKRLGTESRRPVEHGIDEPESQRVGHRFTYRPSRIPWAELWMPFAACALLTVALGIVAYRTGIKRGTDTAQQKVVSPVSPVDALEEQLSDSGHERSQLLAKLADNDKAIKDLRREVLEQSEVINRWKASNTPTVPGTRDEQRRGSNGATEASHRDGELVAAQTKLQELQTRIDVLNQERNEATLHADALESKVSELTQVVRDREHALDQQQAEVAKQQELLEHDRDIRELMGARDLYIAEVHDVAGTGETDKTYGRVFYTKGKSLIFYAYDLDQEAGLKNASTFQAWGRHGVDKQQALNLGIFYEDNVSKKRWVLKFDDPQALAKIDAVFVTAEPNGGSHRPSGKQLLFAYLRVSPNHP